MQNQEYQYCIPLTIPDDLPEEASVLLCQNREQCKTCHAVNPLYCDECIDDFTLQKVQEEEYGFCTLIIISSNPDDIIGNLPSSPDEIVENLPDEIINNLPQEC